MLRSILRPLLRGLARLLFRVEVTARQADFRHDRLLVVANHQSFLERGVDPGRLRGGTIPHEAFNLGELMGLRGRASLLPLLGLWALAGAAMWRQAHRHGG